MYRSVLCMALLSSISLSASAQAFSVESMTITGGSLSITDPYGNPVLDTVMTPGPAATVDDGLLNGVIDADGEHGSVSNPVESTLLLGAPLHGYFTHSELACDWNCNSMITVYDADPDAISMSGSPWDPVISADFSGFFADFNGNKILQGGTATGTGNWIVIPTVEGGAGQFDFELSWSAYNAQGPFQGLTGHWTVTGTAVTAVPEAETSALLLAGLGLVGFAARRRSKAASV